MTAALAVNCCCFPCIPRPVRSCLASPVLQRDGAAPLGCPPSGNHGCEQGQDSIPSLSCILSQLAQHPKSSTLGCSVCSHPIRAPTVTRGSELSIQLLTTMSPARQKGESKREQSIAGFWGAFLHQHPAKLSSGKEGAPQVPSSSTFPLPFPKSLGCTKALPLGEQARCLPNAHPCSFSTSGGSPHGLQEVGGPDLLPGNPLALAKLEIPKI